MYLTAQQLQQVTRETNEWVESAGTIFDRIFFPIEVRFDLKGTGSGMFCVRGTEKYIRYNDKIFARYFDESIRNTVPHEVAHYAVYEIFGRRAKAHGIEWKKLMEAFGVPADVTCSLDVADLATRKLRRFTYRCECGERTLTSIRHNRMQKGLRSYGCPRCNQPLVYSG